MVFTDSCPSRSAISNGAKPISISILAWECLKKSKRLDFLRHSHASLLVEIGFTPLAIAERLGHEKIETTLNTYSHLYPNKQGELADKLEIENSREEEE